mgnify:CR=1 FL=1
MVPPTHHSYHMYPPLHPAAEPVSQATYQMLRKVSDKQLGGLMALLKVQCSKTMEFCAREATQIFGGSGVIRGWSLCLACRV